jgi:hypothetical protein
MECKFVVYVQIDVGCAVMNHFYSDKKTIHTCICLAFHDRCNPFSEYSSLKQGCVLLYQAFSLGYVVWSREGSHVVGWQEQWIIGSYFVFQNLLYSWLGLFVLQGIVLLQVYCFQLLFLLNYVYCGTHRRNQYSRGMPIKNIAFLMLFFTRSIKKTTKLIHWSVE